MEVNWACLLTPRIPSAKGAEMFIRETAAKIDLRKSPTEQSTALEVERLLQLLETCVEEQDLVIQTLANGEEAA